MATPKLETSLTARSAEMTILPILPDGRFVLTSPKGLNVADAERCSCNDFRFRKAVEIDGRWVKAPCKHITAVLNRAV
jgi:hypothetical protein